MESGNGWNIVGSENPAIFYSLVVSGNRIYGAGSNDEMGYVWVKNGDSWSVVGESSPTGQGGSISSIAVNGADVYAGGYDENRIGYVWVESGNGWSVAGGGAPDLSYVTSIAVVGNNLYVTTLHGSSFVSVAGGDWINLYLGSPGVPITSMAY